MSETIRPLQFHDIGVKGTALLAMEEGTLYPARLGDIYSCACGLASLFRGVLSGVTVAPSRKTLQNLTLPLT